jgi:hypothetical protein
MMRITQRIVLDIMLKVRAVAVVHGGAFERRKEAISIRCFMDYIKVVDRLTPL